MLPFGATGSIYFKHDTPKSQQAQLYRDEANDSEETRNFASGQSRTICFGMVAGQCSISTMVHGPNQQNTFKQ